MRNFEEGQTIINKDIFLFLEIKEFKRTETIFF